LRIVITRPIEDAMVLKTKLEAAGHRAIMAPLLKIVPMTDIAIPDDKWQAVAITSANALRAISIEALTKLRSVPMLTVGPQSAQAARHSGFRRVEEAGGDASGLAKHISATRDPSQGPILYLAGREQAGDFASLVGRSGFKTTRIVLYEARPATELPKDAGKADAVVLYSPRTARVWLDLAAQAGLSLSRIKHFCLSANVAAILPPESPSIVVKQPTESAMIEAIGRPPGLA
jgi:uroporphyrinogen-III synthase